MVELNVGDKIFIIDKDDFIGSGMRSNVYAIKEKKDDVKNYVMKVGNIDDNELHFSKKASFGKYGPNVYYADKYNGKNIIIMDKLRDDINITDLEEGDMKKIAKKFELMIRDNVINLDPDIAYKCLDNDDCSNSINRDWYIIDYGTAIEGKGNFNLTFKEYVDEDFFYEVGMNTDKLYKYIGDNLSKISTNQNGGNKQKKRRRTKRNKYKRTKRNKYKRTKRNKYKRTKRNKRRIYY